MEGKYKKLEMELKKDIHTMIRTEQLKINKFIKDMKLAESNRDWKKIKSFHILSTKIPIRISKKIKKSRIIKYHIRNENYEYKLIPNQIENSILVPLKLSKVEYDLVKREIESKIFYHR